MDTCEISAGSFTAMSVISVNDGHPKCLASKSCGAQLSGHYMPACTEEKYRAGAGGDAAVPLTITIEWSVSAKRGDGAFVIV